MNLRRLSGLARAIPLFAACIGRVAADAVDDPAGPEGAREIVIAGRPLAAWVADLNHADAAVRIRAAPALGAPGPEASAAGPAPLPVRRAPRPAVPVAAGTPAWRPGCPPA